MNCGEPRDHLPLARGVCVCVWVHFFCVHSSTMHHSVSMCVFCPFTLKLPGRRWDSEKMEAQTERGREDIWTADKFEKKHNAKAAQENWNREIGWREKTGTTTSCDKSDRKSVYAWLQFSLCCVWRIPFDFCLFRSLAASPLSVLAQAEGVDLVSVGYLLH